MSDIPSSSPTDSRALPEPNPLTRAAHRREVFWQVSLPLIIAVTLCLAAAILAGVAQANTAHLWANISLIFLILIGGLLLIPLLILLGGLVYGVGKLYQILPAYASLVQGFFLVLHRKVRQVSDAAVEPVLRVSSWRAGAGVVNSALQKPAAKQPPS